MAVEATGAMATGCGASAATSRGPMVGEQLRDRLDGLRAEHHAGRKALAGLEVEQAELRDTLLRISGAIQVLEELLDAPTGNGEGDGDGGRVAGGGVR